jgi:hypothetical protein
MGDRITEVRLVHGDAPKVVMSAGVVGVSSHRRVELAPRLRIAVGVE